MPNPNSANNGKANPLNSRPRLRHGLWVQSKDALRKRAWAVRGLVLKARRVMPWLTDADVVAVRAWAEIEIVSAQLWAHIQDAGALRKDGEPRRILTEWRQLQATRLMHLNALCATPAARLALNGSAEKPQDIVALLAQATRVPEDEEPPVEHEADNNE